jgi:hypothetical protein
MLYTIIVEDLYDSRLLIYAENITEALQKFQERLDFPQVIPDGPVKFALLEMTDDVLYKGIWLASINDKNSIPLTYYVFDVLMRNNRIEEIELKSHEIVEGGKVRNMFDGISSLTKKAIPQVSKKKNLRSEYKIVVDDLPRKRIHDDEEEVSPSKRRNDNDERSSLDQLVRMNANGNILDESDDEFENANENFARKRNFEDDQNEASYGYPKESRKRRSF